MNEEYLINSVQEKLNKLLMPSYKNTVVKKAKLGSKTALLGAGKTAAEAIDEYIKAFRLCKNHIYEAVANGKNHFSH